jgi:hypothetical protein
MLKYCINEPYNHWKKENIFIILLQNILLGVNIYNLWDQINTTLINLFVNWTDKIIMAMEINNIFYVGNLRYI